MQICRIHGEVLSLEQRQMLMAIGTSAHHDDGGHHVNNEKPHLLDGIANTIYTRLFKYLTLVAAPVAVDPRMRVYKLFAGSGAVFPHRDVDYAGPDRTCATHSILVYLNEEYTGGETLFTLLGRVIRIPHPRAGDGLLFQHSVLHEGLPVLDGVKYVLKTDLFCSEKAG
jgi:hypothetical protein